MDKILLFSLLSFIAAGSINARDNKFPLLQAARDGDAQLAGAAAGPCCESPR